MQTIDLTLLPPDKLIRDSQVAEIFGTTTGVVRNWRWRRRGPRYVKMGASVRYRVADVRAYLASVTVDPAAKA